jgi:hypothetical protein
MHWILFQVHIESLAIEWVGLERVHVTAVANQ